MKEILLEISQIATAPLNDLHFSFGIQETNDPDTGATIEYNAYDYEKNSKLIRYIEAVDKAFRSFDHCIKDIFFIKDLLSPELDIGFTEKESHVHYLKLQYQFWLIKLATCYDCVLLAINATFELGLPVGLAKGKAVTENSNIIKQEQISKHLANLTKLLGTEFISHNRKKLKSLRRKRNEIVHSNEFEEAEIIDLSMDTILLKIMLINNAEFQNKVSTNSVKLLERINQINKCLLLEVYPILHLMFEEYKVRFDKKLVK